jgi:hypothetical protein
MVTRVGVPVRTLACQHRRPAPEASRRRGMRDVCYILAVMVFFGLMLGYVHWCKRLGRGGPIDEERS